mgnify:FL=1
MTVSEKKTDTLAKRPDLELSSIADYVLDYKISSDQA